MVKLDDDALIQSMRNHIIEVAKRRDVIGYRKLALLVGMDATSEHFAANVGRVLDRINEMEVAQARPLLSAVVCGIEANEPGPGFYDAARRLGLHRGRDDVGFWIEQLNKVYYYWSQTGKP